MNDVNHSFIERTKKTHKMPRSKSYRLYFINFSYFSSFKLKMIYCFYKLVQINKTCMFYYNSEMKVRICNSFHLTIITQISNILRVPLCIYNMIIICLPNTIPLFLYL